MQEREKDGCQGWNERRGGRGEEDRDKEKREDRGREGEGGGKEERQTWKMKREGEDGKKKKKETEQRRREGGNDWTVGKGGDKSLSGIKDEGGGQRPNRTSGERIQRAFINHFLHPRLPPDQKTED